MVIRVDLDCWLQTPPHHRRELVRRLLEDARAIQAETGDTGLNILYVSGLDGYPIPLRGVETLQRHGT